MVGLLLGRDWRQKRYTYALTWDWGIGLFGLDCVLACFLLLRGSGRRDIHHGVDAELTGSRDRPFLTLKTVYLMEVMFWSLFGIGNSRRA